MSVVLFVLLFVYLYMIGGMMSTMLSPFVARARWCGHVAYALAVAVTEEGA